MLSLKERWIEEEGDERNGRHSLRNSTTSTWFDLKWWKNDSSATIRTNAWVFLDVCMSFQNCGDVELWAFRSSWFVESIHLSIEHCYYRLGWFVMKQLLRFFSLTKFLREALYYNSYFIISYFISFLIIAFLLLRNRRSCWSKLILFVSTYSVAIVTPTQLNSLTAC